MPPYPFDQVNQQHIRHLGAALFETASRFCEEHDLTLAEAELAATHFLGAWLCALGVHQDTDHAAIVERARTLGRILPEAVQVQLARESAREETP